MSNCCCLWSNDFTLNGKGKTANIFFSPQRSSEVKMHNGWGVEGLGICGRELAVSGFL